MSALPPLGLYVHIPWCVRKCPYCDFNSHVRKGDLPEANYIDALLRDLEGEAGRVGGRRVETVFFGGGTPSLLSDESLARLLEGIRQRVDLAADAEVTLEANPGTVERGRFRAYRDAGVTRFSVGAQSFGARQLQLLGRIHSEADIPLAVAELHDAGVSNFNLDLMYGLPEQTVDGAVADVAAAVALGPTHISHYQLTLEPGTVFHARPPALPDEELADAIEGAALGALAQAGYERYEISAWTRPGFACRHNLNYWRFGDYLGIGAGAHGKRTMADGVVRTERPKSPREYVDGVGRGERARERAIGADELPFEYFLNALRLLEGFSEAAFEAATGLPIRSVEAPLERALARGLLSCAAGHWRPTALGLRFLNELQAGFLGAAAATG